MQILKARSEIDRNKKNYFLLMLLMKKDYSELNKKYGTSLRRKKLGKNLSDCSDEQIFRLSDQKSGTTRGKDMNPNIKFFVTSFKTDRY